MRQRLRPVPTSTDRGVEAHERTLLNVVSVVPQFRLFLRCLRSSPLDHQFSLVCYCVHRKNGGKGREWTTFMRRAGGEDDTDFGFLEMAAVTGALRTRDATGRSVAAFRMSPEAVTGRFPFLLPGRRRLAAAGWSEGA
ncbi:hypothetical protein EVAR_43579_1 [Eumeta japonica]|uniref:Uncharacterized protein n=1 Tax=Eumeta variegata TaxID=151549 RepID=A0A4C1XF87_EUMVA|nr:hypothetical protein EVAR_43579_1 [Eumeta japonica]